MHPYAGRTRLVLAIRRAVHLTQARLAALARTRKAPPPLFRTSHGIPAGGHVCDELMITLRLMTRHLA
jgi:hypothetical protein